MMTFPKKYTVWLWVRHVAQYCSVSLFKGLGLVGAVVCVVVVLSNVPALSQEMDPNQSASNVGGFSKDECQKLLAQLGSDPYTEARASAEQIRYCLTTVPDGPSGVLAHGIGSGDPRSAEADISSPSRTLVEQLPNTGGRSIAVVSGLAIVTGLAILLASLLRA